MVKLYVVVLLDNVINGLQNYFGIVIRSNCHSVQSMQSSVGVVYHCIEANDREYKTCFVTKVKQPGVNTRKQNWKVFVDKPGIPIVVRDLILPVFTDLSKPDLLKKCLHGKTPNNNECLNGVVWEENSKIYFCWKEST